jgi:Spy/CpxP family protein refolding chaperone
MIVLTSLHERIIKMKIKNLFLALLFGASLVISGVASAQTPVLTPEQKIEKRLAHAQKRLGLTDQQVDQLKTILVQNQQKMQADRQALAATTKGTDARKDALKQLGVDRKDLAGQLKSVLTPEQLRKFKAMRIAQIERRERRLERREKKLMK